MPPAVLRLKNRLATADRRHAAGVALLAAVHLAALGILLWSEAEPAAQAAFVLAWGLLNFLGLVVLRRPLTAAVLSLALIVSLIALSQFKHGVVMTTVTFVDVMIVDVATASFLLAIFPGLAWKACTALVLAAVVLALLWQVEPFQVRRGRAATGFLLCLCALTT